MHNVQNETFCCLLFGLELRPAKKPIRIVCINVSYKVSTVSRNNLFSPRNSSLPFIVSHNLDKERLTSTEFIYADNFIIHHRSSYLGSLQKSESETLTLPHQQSVLYQRCSWRTASTDGVADGIFSLPEIIIFRDITTVDAFSIDFASKSETVDFPEAIKPVMRDKFLFHFTSSGFQNMYM